MIDEKPKEIIEDDYIYFTEYDVEMAEYERIFNLTGTYPF